MHQQTHDAVIGRLQTDFTLKLSSDKQWLRGGRCPACNQKELYAKADKTYTIWCGRLNNCGYSATVKELYPHLFEQWAKRYPRETTNAEGVKVTHPSAAADAYFSEGRGLKLSAALKAAYTQESYVDGKSNKGSATIRFAMPDDGYWERLLDPLPNMQKAMIKSGFKISGHVWRHPTVQYAMRREVWITEAIFDACALVENGIAAVSSISCNNYPSHFLAALKAECAQIKAPLPALVFAFDNDTAGKDFTIKFVSRAKRDGFTVTAAQPAGDKKNDWNDLHLANKLSSYDLEHYRYLGSMLVAENKQDKMLLIHQKTRKTKFPFDFENRTFWADINYEAYLRAEKTAVIEMAESPLSDEDKAKHLKNVRDDAIVSSGSIFEIANCSIQALYFQQNLATDESWYYIRVLFPVGKPIKATFSGAQLSNAGEFKKRLLNVAPGVVYRGDGKMLDDIITPMIENIKRVATIDYIGYASEHSTYVYNQVAFKDGKRYSINAEDYYDLPSNVQLKTLAASPIVSISDKPCTYNFINDIYQAWGIKGIIALVGFVSSLFAHQIRAQQQSWCFLEIVGEAGAGKSTLLKFLWMLLGRLDEEGTNPNKTTHAGLARAMSQTANMPFVFIESDLEDSGRQYDWDKIKDLYGHNATISTRGVKSGGNNTYEPKFKGTIIISQNAAVRSSPAIMSRIVHLYFTRANQTLETQAAVRRLQAKSMDDVSHTTVQIISKETAVIESMSKHKATYEKVLMDDGIRTFRVAHNHAQIIAMYLALAEQVFSALRPYKEEFIQAINTMAHERDRILESESPMVINFWEIYERMEAEKENILKPSLLNHSSKPNEVWIHMSQFYRECAERRFDLPQQIDLMRALKASKRYKFLIENKVAHSALENRTIRVWKFAAPTTYNSED